MTSDRVRAATDHPLRRMQELGQSPWHDNIHRGLLTSGALRDMVREGDITGLTSNPTIFEQAIARTAEYDQALAELVRRGKSAEEVVDALIVEDIRAAAEVFAPIYARTKGADGFVSIEVNPTYANDTETTIREAHRLWRAVARPNLLVKIPGTRAGLPAIEQCIADGLNINITLIFALSRYDEVMEAYLRGIARRLEAGKPVERIASVASFFVSRVDTAVDKLLEQKIAATSGDARRALERLKGRAAIANAKLAYAAFRRKFSSDRFTDLARAGARLQRPLWASTSTKNPAYPDVYYVDALIGPDTVDTMPPETLRAYKDHGHPERRLDQNLDEADRVMAALAEAGISMDAVTQQLEVDGVASFAASFRSLVGVVAARREAELVSERQAVRLGAGGRAVARALATLDRERIGERLWKKDASLWKGADATALGWLDAPETMRAATADLTAFAAALRAEGLTHVLVCGIGGGALAAEVIRKTFGVARGALDLGVLDTIDPAAIAAAEGRSAPERTLYVISSNTGDTAEVNALLAAFWERAVEARGERAGEHFVAITNAGTSLERVARERGFRRVFLNPPDIGDCYSALSYFGLVPAALIGVDLAKLLDRAGRMLRACSPTVKATHNPGLWLGAVLGTLAQSGRDKLTVLAADRIASFATWMEQLIAGSTGKNGRGIVLVPDEPLGPPRVYGRDRVFVELRLGGKEDRRLAALARAGHPTLAYRLADAYDLGAEFVRWEIATVTAAWLLAVNPFDQPDMRHANDDTRRLLAELAAGGRLAEPDGAVAVEAPDLPTRLAAHLRAARPRSYLAVTAFVAPTPRRERLLTELRTVVRDRLRVATTVGFGPSSANAAGQLHRGGPETGVFLQLIGDAGEDVSVAGEPYTFGTLAAAEALEDYQALVARRRPVLRVRLGTAVEDGLRTLLAALRHAPRTATRRPKGPKGGRRASLRRRAARRRAR